MRRLALCILCSTLLAGACATPQEPAVLLFTEYRVPAPPPELAVCAPAPDVYAESADEPAIAGYMLRLEAAAATARDVADLADGQGGSGRLETAASARQP